MDAKQLLVGRRRKMLCQEDMAVYLDISRYRLNNMEEGERPIPPDIALKAQQIFDRYKRDCSYEPHMLTRIYQRDGYNIQRLASASGLSANKIRAIRRHTARVSDKEMEALLNIPPKPNRVRNVIRRKKRRFNLLGGVYVTPSL